MPNKTEPRTGTQRETLELEVEVEPLAREHQENTPLARMAQFEPDNWKAYVTFKINHSLPVVAGPLASGNYTGYHPQVIANSYQGLLHQQANLRHLIKAYDPQNIARDRIVGCIVGVHFPMGNWSALPLNAAAAPFITCVASVFKQAEGVNKLLGQHLSSREKWSVSLEVVFEIATAGVWTAKGGKVIPIPEVPEAMWAAVKRDPRSGRLLFGKFEGEQMVIVPGGSNGTLQYQGVGFTPNPGEKDAEIMDIRAEAMELGEGFMALAAESVPMAMFQRGVWWNDAAGHRTNARVLAVHTEGAPRVGMDMRTASKESPLLHCRTFGGIEVLRSLGSVQPN